MATRSMLVFPTIALVGAVATVLVAPSEARAQDRTWVGGNGPNWSTAANWNPASVPTNGSTLIFPAGSNTSSINDLTGLSVNSITISGSGYTLSGNALTITNAPGIELTTGTARLSMNVTLTTELVQVASGGTLELTGVVTAKFLEKQGPGTLVLTNANAITDIGSQTNCGVIRALNAQALGPTSGGVVTLRDNCTLRIEANTTLEKQFILRGDGAPGATGVLEVEQGVVVALRIDLQNVSPATISVFAGGTLDVLPLPTAIQLQSSLTMNVAGTATIARSLVGNNDLIKTNSGALILTDTNTFNGQTIIRGGTTFINGRQEGSAVSLEGGTVAGTGIAGAITATPSGREISPGVAGPPGTLNSRDVSMNGATTYTVQVTPAQSDQLNVVGTVALGNAQLRVSGTLPAGPVVIINNDGGDPVSGTFAGLPEGATVMVNGGRATISYVGGDGNDVVLNPAAVAPPITISPAMLPNGTVGVPYSQTVIASGGVGQPFMGAATGQLPPGLTAVTLVKGVSASVSGTPTQAGTFTFTLTATDAAKNVGSQVYTVMIAPAPVSVVVVPPSLPNGTVGVAYTQTLSASGGTAPYTLAVTSGTPPVGLTLDPTTGILSGSPTTEGAFNFTVTATDSGKNTGSQEYTVNIAAAQPVPPITISPATLPNGTVGVPYSQTLTATGGAPPYTGSITGTPPPGLTVAPQMVGESAIVSGTPTQAGTFTFTVIASDTANNKGSQSYTITIAAEPSPVTITVSPPTLLAGMVGTPYSQTITATGGTAPYTFAVSTGTLPAGLTLNPTTGGLSGTPTTAGASTFTISATDATNATGTRSYTVTVTAATASITISPTTLPNGTVGVPYSQTLTASGGTPPYKGSTAGTLPPGLTAASLMVGQSAIIAGTPTQPGTFTFTVIATDTQSQTGSQQYTVTISAAPQQPTITLAPPSLPNGTVGIGYSQTITASGGTGPYAFAVTAGSLPAGLSLAGGGGLGGTPTTPGTYNFTVTATDATSNTGTRAYALTVTETPTPPITLSPTNLPNGTVGTPYAQTVTALGGNGGPYALSISAGTIPIGLTFTNGLLSGTPGVAGDFTFTVTARDAANNTGSQAYTITIQGGGAGTPIVIAPETIPNGTVGAPYSQGLSATGGAGGPYTFVVTGGTLPAGLSLSAAGVISGTPTTPGQFTFTVTATDSAGNTGSRAYTGAISATPVPALPWWVLVALSYFAIRLAASRVRNRTVR